MFADLGLGDMTPAQAALWLGLLIGLLFGLMAQPSRFCFRRAVAGDAGERASALGVWMAGLATAVAGTQLAVARGLISFDGHRLSDPVLPVLAVVLGGLLFGAGMVLTRGCISRLTVLGASGNLRGLTVLLIFGVVAHATLKGVLAPLRVALGGVTVDLGAGATLAGWPGGAALWAAGIVALALLAVARSGARPRDLLLGALIGLLVPAAWVGTGYVLFDDFDPIAMESLSLASPSADALFWLVASSSVSAGFGTGLVGGVLVGAFVAAQLFGGFRWQSFESPAQTGRYVAGAVMMGFGAVLAGGCTLGAGLSGVPTLGVAALLALAAIAVGALVMRALLTPRGVAVAA